MPLSLLVSLVPLVPLVPLFPDIVSFITCQLAPTKSLSSFCLTYCSSPNLLSALLAMEAGVANWSIPGMQAHRCR